MRDRLKIPALFLAAAFNGVAVTVWSGPIVEAFQIIDAVAGDVQTAQILFDRYITLNLVAGNHQQTAIAFQLNIALDFIVHDTGAASLPELDIAPDDGVGDIHFDGAVCIDEGLCTGCGLCGQICPVGAIGGGNHE